MGGRNEIDAVVTRLLRAASRRRLRIATAESCSGGLIASLLTDVEGLGHVFERGFVTYSETAKADMLGVSPRLIAQAGLVSAPVAAAMARGALARSGADIALGITGFAGPAGSEDEEGLVHIAAVDGDRLAARELHLGPAGREAVRGRSAQEAIALLLELIETGHEGE